MPFRLTCRPPHGSRGSPLGVRACFGGGSRARSVHSAGGERPAPQTRRRVSAHPGRPPGAGLVVLSREAHPAGRPAGLVRRLGDAGPPLPQARPPAPPLRPGANWRGSPGCRPGGSRMPSAGSRRRGCWAGRSPPWNSRPRPRPSPCPTATASGGSSTGSPTMTGGCRCRAASSRLLAGGARPALIATILGHLLRCLYLKGGKCSARGRVKASWIAEHLRRRPAPGQGGAAGADRHGLADPAGGSPVGAQPLGGPRPHQPGLVAARRDRRDPAGGTGRLGPELAPPAPGFRRGTGTP